MGWLDRIRRELAVEDGVPFLGKGVLARTWRGSTRLRGTLFLGLGSAWDAVTLSRMDRLSDQVFLATYQVALAVLVVLQLRQANDRRVPGFVARNAEIVHFATQFLLGGLLSAFTIYYVRGAASPRAVVFVALLVGLLVANEYADQPLRVLWARVALLAFCQFNGLLFALPLLTGTPVGAPYVAAMTMVSVVLLLVVVRPRSALAEPGVVDHLATFARASLPAAATLGVVLVLIWAQVLPPLPLSLHRVGVFHAVEHRDDGYALTWERAPIVGLWFWRYDRVFHRQPGEAAWCFSSVFAPGGIDLQIHHLWEQYDREEGWVERDDLVLDVAGGRAEGFRTYSRKENLEPGPWRVRILLPTGRELGRVRFEVIDGPPEQPLVTQVF